GTGKQRKSRRGKKNSIHVKNRNDMENTYLQPAINGTPNLYAVQLEFQEIGFGVAIQGGIDFEARLAELVSECLGEFLKEDSIQRREGSKDYENKWQAETTEGENIYINSIDIW